MFCNFHDWDLYLVDDGREKCSLAIIYQSAASQTVFAPFVTNEKCWCVNFSVLKVNNKTRLSFNSLLCWPFTKEEKKLKWSGQIEKYSYHRWSWRVIYCTTMMLILSTDGVRILPHVKNSNCSIGNQYSGSSKPFFTWVTFSIFYIFSLKTW